MLIVALIRQKSLGKHNQFLIPTRKLYHFRDSGLWLEDYHLQRELEMLVEMMIVALSRQKSVGIHNQFLFPTRQI